MKKIFLFATLLLIACMPTRTIFETEYNNAVHDRVMNEITQRKQALEQELYKAKTTASKFDYPKKIALMNQYQNIMNQFAQRSIASNPSAATSNDHLIFEKIEATRKRNKIIVWTATAVSAVIGCIFWFKKN